VVLHLIKQEAFEKCWAHSPRRAAARRLFYIAIHQASLLSHAAYALMSTTTTTTRDRGPLWPHRMGPISTSLTFFFHLYVSDHSVLGAAAGFRRHCRSNATDTRYCARKLSHPVGLQLRVVFLKGSYTFICFIFMSLEVLDNDMWIREENSSVFSGNPNVLVAISKACIHWKLCCSEILQF